METRSELRQSRRFRHSRMQATRSSVMFPMVEWPSVAHQTLSELAKECASNALSPEQKSVESYHTIENEDLLTRFSSFPRALRVIAYVYRFIRSAREEPIPTTHTLTQDEISYVKTRLIICAQHNHYAEAVAQLEAAKPVNKKARCYR